MGTPELIGGPYAAPAVRAGDWLDDEIDGSLQVGGWTSAPIPWPRRKKTGRAALILCGDLVRAIRIESAEAVCYWWGVGPTKVWMWRQALGVGRVTDGTRKLLQERTGVPPEAAARGREKAAAPESRAKMAESKRGMPMPPQTRAALIAAAKRPKPVGWGIRANAWMLGRPLPTPERGARYTNKERDFMQREFNRRPAAEIAAILGRPLSSVVTTAWHMGLRGRSRQWPPELDARLIESANLSLKQLAQMLGRSVGAVAMRRMHLGLTRKRKTGK